jgi:hypothetical protein
LKIKKEPVIALMYANKQTARKDRKKKKEKKRAPHDDPHETF